MYPLIDLTGRHIIITGASRGIGRETAILFSKLDAKLTLIARNEEGLNETLGLLEGEGHTHRAFDLSNLEGIDSLTKDITSELGPADGLAYCAGITNDRPFHMVKPDSLEAVLRVNLKAFIETVRCLSRKGRFNPGFRIAAVSSIASLVGKEAHLSYSVSKAGINEAVRCMARELSDKGICVNAVLPGMIDTDMYRKYLDDNGGADSPVNKALLRRQYLGIGRPLDVAMALAFLISPAAKYITGISMPVDGGFTSN